MTSRLAPAPRLFVVSILLGVMAAVPSAIELAAAREPPHGASAPRSSPEEMSGDQLFSELLEHNHSREERLLRYAVVRTYMVKSDKDTVYATTVVRMQYQAPGAKQFATVSEEGSGVIRSVVFRRLMESEVEAAKGRGHRDSSISPDNYTFRSLGEEDGGGRHYFVVKAVPKRKDKFLFEGKVWIDAQDFAVAKIVGRPAKNPSFWIKQVDFVRQYQKIGEFWLPLQDESVSDVRIFGKRVLTIDHRSYVVNGATP